MAFSSVSEFLFMAGADIWVLETGKSQGAKSGEYSGWAMTFVSCWAKNSVTIRLEFRQIQVFRYESGGDALPTQNMNHNMLSRSIRDVDSLCNLSNANTTIFENNLLHFFDDIVVNDFMTLTECFMPLKFLRSR